MTPIAFDSAKVEAAIRSGRGPQMLEWIKTKGVAFDDSLAPRIMTRDMAMDAQSELVTVTNGGIPAFLANWLDPKVIQILVSPMMAAVIAGESAKGEWTTETAMFITAESVGETSAYGDYSQSGSSNVNTNFPTRQNWLFQAFMQYGQRELARAGLAKLDWASLQQQSNTLTLLKALNALYMFGVSGLNNYGLLNDPTLPPALTPTYSWLGNASATALTIYQDVVRMFIQLQLQSGGVVRMDHKLVLAMSPAQAVALTEVTQYNTNSVLVLLKQNYPNIRLETAVEYQTASGQLVQLIAEEIDGHRTLEAAYSVKLLAHNMVADTSSWRQKRTSGGFGTIWFRPFLCVQMLG